MGVVLVSHDRAFMEAVCSRILELDQGSAYAHALGGPGSYELFRQARLLVFESLHVQQFMQRLTFM